MSRYESYVNRGKAQWGSKFTASELAKNFIPAYNSQERIRVKFHTGEVLSGTVGATTGWRPSFMLMLRSNSLGSSWLLTSKDKIVPNTTPIKRY